MKCWTGKDWSTGKLAMKGFCHTRPRGNSSLLCEPVNFIRRGANDVSNSGFGYFDIAVDLLGIPGFDKYCTGSILAGSDQVSRCHKFDLERK